MLAIGGFNGTDPLPTLAEFQALVRAGKVHYFMAGGDLRGPGGAGGAGGPGGASGTSRGVSSWVTADFTSTTVDRAHALRSHQDRGDLRGPRRAVSSTNARSRARVATHRVGRTSRG